MLCSQSLFQNIFMSLTLSSFLTFQNGCNLAWPLSPFPGNRQSNQSICCNNEEKGRETSWLPQIQVFPPSSCSRNRSEFPCRTTVVLQWAPEVQQTCVDTSFLSHHLQINWWDSCYYFWHWQNVHPFVLCTSEELYCIFRKATLRNTFSSHNFCMCKRL